MNGPLIFITIWLLLVIIGLVNPKTFLPLLIWQMKYVGELFGFKIELKSDEILCKPC